MFDQHLRRLFGQLMQGSNFHWIVIVVDEVLFFFWVFFGGKFSHSCDLGLKQFFRYIWLQRNIFFSFADRFASQRGYLTFLITSWNGFCWKSFVFVLLLRWEGPVDDILALVPTTINGNRRWIWLQLQFLFLFHSGFLICLNFIPLLLFFFSDYLLLFSGSFADRHLLKRSLFNATQFLSQVVHSHYILE